MYHMFTLGGLILFAAVTLGLTLFAVGWVLINRYFSRRERIIKKFESENREEI